jgi:hypothetical protein
MVMSCCQINVKPPKYQTTYKLRAGKRLGNHDMNVEQLKNKTTYMLRAGRGHKTMRSMLSS